MRGQKRLVIILVLAPMLFIPAAVVLIEMMAIKSEQVLFDQSLQQLEREYIESETSSMRAKVDSVVELIAYRKSIIDQKLHRRIQTRVKNALKIAHHIHHKFSANYSEQEVKQMILSALRPLIWNGGESFIWILDYDGVFYLAPEYLRHLEGSSIIDFRDATGREVIKEEIQLVQTVGHGFLWDTFTKPNEDPNKQFKQLAYVEDFGFYNWYMGSGEYLDTATKATDKQLIESIAKVDQVNQKSLFIFKDNGELLLSSAYPQKVGQNLADAGEGAVEAASTSFQYKWIDSISRLSKSKHIYVKRVKGTDWIVGSIFYGEDLLKEIGQTKVALTQQHQQRLENMKEMGALSVAAAIMISLFLSLAVHSMLKRYQMKLAEKSEELERLNSSLEEKVASRTAQLEMANERLEVLATTDSLTGLYNRYAFMEVIDNEVKRSNRYESHFSIISFDIDYFKNVNDQFGHDVGDRVLIELTSLVHSILRDVDTFCRMGGEEFVILLPYTNLPVAFEVGDRIRRLIESHEFERTGHLTISLGVVEHGQGEQVDEVLKRADIALYQSKDDGRNQITRFDL